MSGKERPLLINAQDFDGLLSSLKKLGYTTYGPTVRDGAVIYDVVDSANDLPIGIGDVQVPGSYRLRKREDGALFGYVVGPHSWKRFLHPPTVKLYTISSNGKILASVENANQKMAFVGVRPCELQAIRILDKVLLEGEYPDPVYAARRKDVFLLAVNCVEPSGNCFCASMGTGPEAKEGFDLCLTELLRPEGHSFLVKVGTEKGKELISSVPHRQANDDEIELASKLLALSRERMEKKIEINGLKDLLYRNLEHPHWDEVAKRCLACGNCTMVCPTCFCTTVSEATDLFLKHAERWRRWDTCFSQEFSYIHGGPIRYSISARYRHWLMHKMATWVDQFGTPGCVGCGRCITWCPVGIDITEEVKQIGKRDGEVKVKVE